MTLRVLFVDDEEDIRDIAVLGLGLDDDMEIRSCASGVEALDMTSSWQPDVILLDVMMPRMDGPTLLQEFRARPATARTPVIFVTALTQSEKHKALLAAGALAVITKPFNPITLSQTVRTTLGASAGGS